MKDTLFLKQAELLLKIVPIFKGETVFAIKSGTATNLFYRNLPRLPIDIELTNLSLSGREIA